MWRAQQNFDLYAASHHQWINRVRRPTTREARERRPSDVPALMRADRDEVLTLIEPAFADVRRAGGTTLREARELDNYGGAEAAFQARSFDTDQDWREVADADLATYADTLNFMNEDGFRYYLPAFMRWDLGCFRRVGASPKSQLMNQLVRGRAAWTLAPAQANVVHRYIRFMAEYGDEYTAKDARDALSRHWEAR